VFSCKKVKETPIIALVADFIFPELIGSHRLNYVAVDAAEARAAGFGSTAPVSSPESVEQPPLASNEVGLAAQFLKARGPASNALHREMALNANLEHTRGAIQILRGMDDVSNRHGHLLGLELNAIGDRLRQVDLSSKPGNLIKVAVGAGVALLAYHTATEGLSTISAAQQLATGASDLTYGIQHSPDVFHIDFTHINVGGQEMNQVISKLTQHGIDTVVSGVATAGAVLARPFEVVRKATHGIGRAFNVGAAAIGKAMGTENVIQSAQVPSDIPLTIVK
jgi:hypothetical protein